MDNCVDLAVFLGGTVNLNNLKLFRIVIRDGCPVLEKGTMPINPGEITLLDSEKILCTHDPFPY